MSRTTFNKADRLRKRQEFLYLFKKGRRVHTAYFMAMFVPTDQPSRLGITASKKVGKAVRRNRVKRLTREYFRQNRNRIRGQWDINIVAKSGSANLVTPDVFRQLQKLLDRISRSADY
ncbi:MAG: ribonuclease P protein component [Desulfobacterales bacterium]|nr:ribonuclease P protein component [Desulfobacterales bacterium]